MITGPEPEQVEEGRVLHLRHRSKPTECPSILHEGKVLPDEGDEAEGRRGEKTENKNFSKTENKTRERLRLLTFFLLGSSLLSRSTPGSRENEETRSFVKQDFNSERRRHNK